jgi:hypothetical protein
MAWWSLLLALDSRSAHRIGDLLRASRDILEHQSKVFELVNMPNWLSDTNTIPSKNIEEFRELRVHDIRFSYKPNETLIPAAIDLYGMARIRQSFINRSNTHQY